MSPSRRNRSIVRERACIICGYRPCDPHHFPVRTSHGGPDTLDNMVPLCHLHHRLFHDGEEWVVRAVECNAPAYFEVSNAS